MNTDQKHLRIMQLDKQIALFSKAQNLSIPGGGWVHAIRSAIGMSLKQLGERLQMTPQGAKDIEKREEEGSITLRRLKEVALAMDLQLVYGLIPKEHSLEKMIEQRAYEMAKKIVLKTAHTMNLENQGIEQEALKKAIEKRAEKIKTELPKLLWE